MAHPFAEHIALQVLEQVAGRSRCELTVAPEHRNPHGVVHGAVLFALADTGMGAALYPTLQAGESCATVEIKISFHRPVVAGTLRCDTTLVHRGRSIASLDSTIYVEQRLVGSATGTYAIFAKRPPSEPGPEDAAKQ